ncbi:MAG TPA: hypothetical protein VFA34_07595 [Actinomycetota bacterium]|jgi:hypothetical protein|nr:hypothetical protein [Actinomycetota bacterium]
MSRNGKAAARAETQKEAKDSFVLPQLGVLMTKEGAAGFALAVPLFALVGALLFFPLGFIEIYGIPMVTRLIIAAAVGATAGAVVGFVVGPSVGVRRAARQRAGASRGRQSRPGKAEIAEATGGHEDGQPPKRRTA